jgi:hypothetical protein
VSQKSIDHRCGQRQRAIRVARINDFAEIAKVATQLINQRTLIGRLLQIHNQPGKVRADAEEP